MEVDAGKYSRSKKTVFALRELHEIDLSPHASVKLWPCSVFVQLVAWLMDFIVTMAPSQAFIGR